MLKVYGSMLCPDCVECCAEFEKNDIDFMFLDFADNLWNLKTFLALRDSNECFNDAKEVGYIGIPCIVEEDGTIELCWKRYVGQA